MATVSELLAGGSSSFKFDAIGTSHTGTIVNAEVTQQTDFDSGDLLTWQDGKPRLQIVVNVTTDERDPSDPHDEGRRTFYFKGNALKALKAETSRLGVKELEPGGVLTVTFTAEGERGLGGRGNPQKIYSVQYQPPAQAAVADVLETPTAAPAVTPEHPANQAPAAPAPAATQAPANPPAAAPVTPEALEAQKEQLRGLGWSEEQIAKAINN